MLEHNETYIVGQVEYAVRRIAELCDTIQNELIPAMTKRDKGMRRGEFILGHVERHWKPNSTECEMLQLLSDGVRVWESVEYFNGTEAASGEGKES